jgi:hypothetical protein
MSAGGVPILLPSDEKKSSTSACTGPAVQMAIEIAMVAVAATLNLPKRTIAVPPRYARWTGILQMNSNLVGMFALFRPFRKPGARC